MNEAVATLYYVHDPMCSWCWAYRPRMLELRDALVNNWSGSVAWQNVLGGLAADSDEPMPQDQQQMIRSHWLKIQQITDSRFNFDFWTRCEARRDTYKACRAVIAAAEQQAEDPMIEAIQRAYYLRALNPSDPQTLVQLAAEQGLAQDRFEQDFNSSATEQKLQKELALRSSLGVRSFPSLVLGQDKGFFRIDHDYHQIDGTLRQIEACLVSKAATGYPGD